MLMCIARGDLPNPLQNITPALSYCFSFFYLNKEWRKKERKKVSWVLEALVGSCLKKWFGFFKDEVGLFSDPCRLCSAPLFLLGPYPRLFRWVGPCQCVSSVDMASTRLTLYSCCIGLQQGTNIGPTPSTTKRLCF